MIQFVDTTIGGVKYAVHSADSRVYSYSVLRFLRGEVDRNGYICFKLGTPTKSYKIARLVLTVFVRPPSTGEQARHLDDNKRNNDLSNLAWGTGVDNWTDRKRNGNGVEGEKHGRAILTEEAVKEIRTAPKEYGYRKRLALKFGVSLETIYKVCSGETWQCIPPQDGTKSPSVIA